MSVPAQQYKRQTLWYQQKGKCLYCNKPLKSWLSEDSCFDHIYPRSLDGPHINENLALVCYPCNSLKSDFTSLWQVIVHFFKMFKLFWRLLEIPKTQKALEDGKMKSQPVCKCKCHARKKLPNAISKVGKAPTQPGNGRVRIEAYERRLAEFQRITSSPIDSSKSS